MVEYGAKDLAKQQNNNNICNFEVLSFFNQLVNDTSLSFVLVDQTAEQYTYVIPNL